MKRRSIKTYLLYLVLFAMALIVVFATTFYGWFLSLTEKRSEEYFENISAKSEQNVVTYLDEMAKVANLVSYSSTVQDYLFEKSIYQVINSQSAATDLLNSIMASYDNICEIALYKENGFLFQATGSYSAMIRSAVDNPSILADFTVAEPFYSGVIYNTANIHDSSTPYFLYVYPIYSLVEGEFSPQNSAVCLILGRLGDLVSQYAHGYDMEETRIALLEQDQVLISSKNLSQEGQSLVGNVEEGSSYLDIGNERHLVYRHVIRNTNLSMVVTAPVGSMNSDLKPIKLAVQIFILLSALLMLLICYIGIKSISQPINNLLLSINAIDLNSNYNYHVPDSSVSEINQISGGINNMLQKISKVSREQKETQEALYEVSLARKQAQLQYYRSQINPHFLYNTLECIRSMAQIYKAGCIESICLSMARMFRYSASDATEASLGDEIANARDYFNVISQRSPGHYRLSMSIPEEANVIILQKMILQPIIENAIKHGFDGKDPPCNVFLRARLLPESVLELSVSDNGYGIPERQVAQLNEKMKFHHDADGAIISDSGIGLLNISRRLRLIYGSACTMSLASKHGHYTRVQIRIPVSRAQAPPFPSRKK